MTIGGATLVAPDAPRVAGAVSSGPVHDRRPHNGWLDDLRLSAVGGGAGLIAFGPGAWVTVDHLSPDIVAFSVIVLVQHFLSALAQCAALRGLDRMVGDRPVPIWLRFIVAVIPGLAVGAAALNDPAVRLGLSIDSWVWRQGWTLMSSYLPMAFFIVWMREGRDRERAARLRLFRLQQAQLESRRSIVDAQLRAVQARVDPQFFFDTLDAAERLYRADPPRAEALLDSLVEFLRAALPRMDRASSVLTREIDLASAAVRIAVLATGREHRLEADLEPDLGTAPFPSGVLLPLVRAALTAAPGAAAVMISVRREEGPTDATSGDDDPPSRPAAVLAVVIQAGMRTPADVISALTRILTDLYGTDASLTVAPGGASGFETIVRVPYAEPC